MAKLTKRLPMLPAERALKVISGRWKAVILYHLFDGPRRLSVLKTLEEHGLIRREIFAEIPSRVEYSATRLGLSMEPILLALCEWGQHHADELNEMDRVADCIIRPRQARASQPSPE
jgi:DNA-binding HxlR family transcriptional regulator